MAVTIEEPIPSKDATLILTINEEKMIKRMRQIGSGMMTIIIIESRPIVGVVNGKVEVLGK